MTLPARETRQKLVAEALVLMDGEGLSGVRARDLSKRVGVSVGTIYNLFGSLDGLIDAACQEILDKFARTAMRAVAAGEASREGRLGEAAPCDRAILEDRLLGLARIYMAYVDQNHQRWSAMLAFVRTRRLQDIEQGGYDLLQGELFGYLKNALENTRYADDPELRCRTARMLWSAVHGIVTMNYVGQSGKAARADTWEQVRLLVASFVRDATIQSGSGSLSRS